MKKRFSNPARYLCVLWLAVLAAEGRTYAQTPAGLGIQTYAGLTITGAVGTVYSIEYVTDLAQTNALSAWRCLGFLQLPTSPYLWTDKSAPVTAHRFYRAATFAALTNLAFIPPGTFRMGSPTNEVDRSPNQDGFQTDVIIRRGFWMGKYEVTQGEYLAVMGGNPSLFNGDRSGQSPPFNHNYGTDLTRPVDSVSWEDATSYCGKLTQRERAAGRIATNSVYRLPTEAEWEYACRGWTSDRRFSYGDDPGYTNLADFAWYADNSGGMTHPVGQKLPNQWGLYDMYGNVSEWCQDDYPGGVAGIVVDPQGPGLGPFSLAVVRGGGGNATAESCRSASRVETYPLLQDVFFGFRAVLAPGQP